MLSLSRNKQQIMYNKLNDTKMERFNEVVAREAKYRMDCVLSTIANRMNAFAGDILICHSTIEDKVLHSLRGAVCGIRATGFDVIADEYFEYAIKNKEKNNLYEWIMNVKADMDGEIEVRLYETTKKNKEMCFKPTSVFTQTYEEEVSVYKVYDDGVECEVVRSEY